MSGEGRTARELAHEWSGCDQSATLDGDHDGWCDVVTGRVEAALALARNLALEEAAQRCDAVRAAGGDAFHCAVQIRALIQPEPKATARACAPWCGTQGGPDTDECWRYNDTDWCSEACAIEAGAHPDAYKHARSPVQR